MRFQGDSSLLNVLFPVLLNEQLRIQSRLHSGLLRDFQAFQENAAHVFVFGVIAGGAGGVLPDDEDFDIAFFFIFFDDSA